MIDETVMGLALIALGGVEMRWAMHRAFSRLNGHGLRLKAIERHLGLVAEAPDVDPFGDTPTEARPAVGHHRRLGMVALIVGAALALGLGGCSQADVDRAQAVVAEATAREAQASHAVELAQQAVDQAKALADQVGSVQAQHVVAQAQSALTAAVAARDVAQLAVTGAKQAADAASAAQSAGGSTLDILAGAAGALLPGVPALVAALVKLRGASTAFRQTVAGLDRARASMGEDAWNQHVAPHLESAQDATVKAAVAKAQSATAAGV